MTDRERILDELGKMTSEELEKPILMRMGGVNHNVISGRDLLDALNGGGQRSFGQPSSNPGGLVSKDKVLDKLKKII